MFLKLFSKYPNQTIIAISGNHDHATKNLLTCPAETALTHIASIFPRQFILIDNDMVDLERKQGIITITGIPYYEYKEHFITQLTKLNEQLDSNVKNILIIHQTPKHSNPFIPHDFEHTDPIFDDYDLVLCGHIHGKQKLSDNFWIVGSPIHKDLSDEGKIKGFLVLDTEDLTNPKFIHLDKYPVYKRGTDIDNDSIDYVVPILELEEAEINADDLDPTKFTADNDRGDLLTNYWQEVDGKDKELLKIGLKFIS